MLRYGLLLILIISVISAPAMAQDQDPVCSTIVAQALDLIADNCGGLGRNTVCYGASLINSTPANILTSEFLFSQPGDTQGIENFSEISPQGFDATNQTFGVAVLKIGAIVENTIPGQMIDMLLMGESETTFDSSEQAIYSVYFRPGIGFNPNTRNCIESKPTLAIQSPDNIQITIYVNSVEVQIGSLVTFTENTISVHRGSIVLRTGSTLVIVNVNETVEVGINANNSYQLFRTRGITIEEYLRGLQIQEALNQIAIREGKNPNSVAPPPSQFPAPTPICSFYHTIQPTDTINGIAQLYNTNASDIVTVNNINVSNQPSSGQTICIPNPNTGFVPLPESNAGNCPPIPALPAPFPPIPAPPQGLFDCSGF